jgi:hypothetical protein
MTDYVRTQILLERKQRQQLDEIAEELGVSLSELVRNFLNAQLRQRTYEAMEQAAKLLYPDYERDEDLTAMTALDSEDVFNA